MTDRFRIRSVLALAAILVLSGCANTVSREVADNNRDTSGRYDGTWMVVILPAASIQTIEQWRFQCDGMEGQFPVDVRDGKLFAAKDGDGFHQTNVSRKGKFRLNMPTADMFQESARSSASIYASDVTYIVQGSLAGKQPSGYLTAGVAQFGNNGCTTKLQFELQE